MASAVNAGARLDQLPISSFSLLVSRIIVVWAWGVEPRARALEDVATGLSRARTSCVGRPATGRPIAFIGHARRFACRSAGR
jgi:hypothetical protein